MNSHILNHKPISIEEREGVTVVHLQGPLGLETVNELRTALYSELELKRSVRLDLKDSGGDPDLCGLQLLYSAHQSFRSAGVRFEISGLSGQVRNFARSAGYDASGSQGTFGNEGCPWMDCPWMDEPLRRD